MADIAATMAGVPNPWLIMEKWVKCLWMAGSMMGEGLVLQSGDRSWFRKSTSSLQMNLKHPGSERLVRAGCWCYLVATRRSFQR